jgi:hypothetical protein
MGYLPPTTIASTLRQLQSQELILPAIQREYVWEADQIVALFDSIMRGYPVGGFLSWKVEPQTIEQFKFYGFLRDYSRLDNFHCPLLDVPPTKPVTAVLDGQQRLTSLNIGLRGSFADRVRGGWTNNPAAYPKRRLYLNVLADAPENESGLLYDIRFIRDDQLEQELAKAKHDEATYWLPISEIFVADEAAALIQVLAKHGIGNDPDAAGRVSKLWNAVHNTAGLHFYEETDQDVERVLDIFIRVNSGGTVLSYSDLLLSIATAQWKERDARQEINSLVDGLNAKGQGFRFSKDVVLKAALVLAGVSDFAFKVKNFNTMNMTLLDKEWDSIADSLELAADLLADFGLSDATLSADSVIVPVAYYVHRRGLGQSYRTSTGHSGDRALVRLWVLRTLILPGIWGSGLDTLLRDLRTAIDDDGANGFPVKSIEQRMEARGKGLTFTDAVIDELLTLAYGKRRTFALLALLFPHVDTRNVHHVDHIFPAALLHKTKLKASGFGDTEIDRMQTLRDQLPNLQLLEGPNNIAKSAQNPGTWAAAEFPDESKFSNYLSRNALPDPLPESANEFTAFFEARRALLVQLVKKTVATG